MGTFLERLFLDLSTDNRGTTAVEYGLIIAMVSLVVIVPLAAIGGDLVAVYDLLSSAMTIEG